MYFFQRPWFYDLKVHFDGLISVSFRAYRVETPCITVKEFPNQCNVGRWSIMDKIWTT
jgi:hypothetical protein